MSPAGVCVADLLLAILVLFVKYQKKDDWLNVRTLHPWNFIFCIDKMPGMLKIDGDPVHTYTPKVNEKTMKTRIICTDN